MGIPDMYTLWDIVVDAALPHCAVPQDECCAAAEESGETKVRQAAEEGPSYPTPYTKPTPDFFNPRLLVKYKISDYEPIVHKFDNAWSAGGFVPAWFSYVVLPS